MSSGRPTVEQLTLAALETGQERRLRPESLSEADRQELVAFEAVVGELGLAAAPVEPSEDLRDRLLRGIAAPPPKRAGVLLDEGGVLIASPDAMPWKPHPIPGLETKILHLDRITGVATALYRLAPGASVPAHRHAGLEEVLILSGDLEVHGHRMSAGDYCRAESESVHHATKTEQGAVFLVRGSIHNEMLES